jgi:hypothetical protein
VRRAPKHLHAAFGPFADGELQAELVSEDRPQPEFDGGTRLHFVYSNGHVMSGVVTGTKLQGDECSGNYWHAQVSGQSDAGSVVLASSAEVPTWRIPKPLSPKVKAKFEGEVSRLEKQLKASSDWVAAERTGFALFYRDVPLKRCGLKEVTDDPMPPSCYRVWMADLSDTAKPELSDPSYQSYSQRVPVPIMSIDVDGDGEWDTVWEGCSLEVTRGLSAFGETLFESANTCCGC